MEKLHFAFPLYSYKSDEGAVLFQSCGSCVCVCSGITKYIEKISYFIVHLVSELGNNPYFLLKICKLLQSPDSARNCQLFHIELCIFHI